MIKKITLFVLLFCTVQMTAQDNKVFPLKFAFRHSDTMRAALPIASINNTNATVYNAFRNEFWMASSHNDSLMRFSVPAGQYLGAVRAIGLVAPAAFTTRYFRGLTVKDNYFIWGANNTDTIRKIDPTTAQEVQRIVVPKWIGNISYITFDSTRGGAFWISGLDSKIRRIDSTFTTVTDSLIIDASFNSGGFTGIAFDALSAGGPYIWILGARHPEVIQFGIQNSFVTAIQISVATKLRTGVQKTIVDDFTFLLNTNQSGRGFTIAQLPNQPKPVMIFSTGKFTSGSSQLGINDLSGVTAAYELNTTTTSPDASLDSIIVTPNYSMLPSQFVRPLTVSAKVRNGVSNATTAGNLRIVTTGPAGDTINNQTASFNLNPATAAFIPVTNTITGVKKGLNTIRGTTITANDPVIKNDTLRAFFQMSDSTIARDYVDFYNIRALESFIYGGSNSLYHTMGVGATMLIPERPEVGQGYKLDWPVTITSATVRIRPFRSGDTTRIKVYTIDANGKPQYAGQSALYQISVQDSATDVMTIPLAAPVTIAAGQEFMLSVTEGFNAPNVWGTPMGYEKGKTFFHLLSTYKGWVNPDTLPAGNFYRERFNRALAIRPNIRLRTDIGETTNVGKLSLSPNPTSGLITLDVDMNSAEDLVVRVTNLSGQTVLSQKFDAAKSINQRIDLSQQANGIYIFSLTTAKGTLTRKVVKE
jgi:Secretion system C-terminal sorting domain